MFWEEEATQNLINLNSLETLLSNKEDVSLKEILDDPFLLQELRQSNPKVISILTSDDNIVQLTRNALQPTIDQTLPLEQHYTLANLSTEILTVSNVNEIMEAFIQNKECMQILSDALNDPAAFNSVLAIFYGKIFATMMSKNFAATLAFMKETDFLEKSRHFLKFGAIADLLECLIRLNNGEEEIRELREYLVEAKFIPKLISLLDQDVDIPIHENAADVFIDVLRNLREMLTVTCEKSDSLHDVFLQETTVKEILQRMLKKEENGQKIENEVRASLVMNGMNMLSAMIELNAAGTTPSQFLETGEADTVNWIGGGPEIWLPDVEKVAETLTAQRTADMVQIIVEDLSIPENLGNCWVWMLKLLSELANTNHLPTHQLLVAGFKQANFKQLFQRVLVHPLAHIFQHQIRNIVAYSLFSNTGETVSPLIGYFLSECDLFYQLKSFVYPLANDFPKITLYSIRSFHIYLADIICKASRKAPHATLIEEYLKNSADWSGDGAQTVAKGLDIYWKKNRPDELKSSEPKIERFQPAADFPEDNEAFNRLECSSEIEEFEPVNLPTPDPLLVNFNAETAVPQDGMHINLRDKDPNEEIFENACQFTAFDLFSMPAALSKTKTTLEMKSTEPKKLSWPGEAANTTTSNGSDDFWDQSPAGRLSNGSNSSSDDWPVLNTSSDKDDSFKETFTGADFANFQSAMDCLDDSVKGDEKSASDVWDDKPIASAGWVADFKSPAASPRDPFSVNESEA